MKKQTFEQWQNECDYSSVCDCGQNRLCDHKEGRGLCLKEDCPTWKDRNKEYIYDAKEKYLYSVDGAIVCLFRTKKDGGTEFPDADENGQLIEKLLNKSRR